MNKCMKKQLVLGFFLAVGHCAMAQITFEPGYFISNDGQRTECQIKNLDWKSNPTTFEYRANGVDGKGDIQTISEFSVTGSSVFRRFEVDIDRSSSDLSKLTTSRNLQFKRETLFLRLLVSGKAMLYMYEDQGLIRFFYSNDGSPLTQLAYKRYLQTSDKGFETGFAKENEQYKQDLLNQLKCASITQRDVERLKYERPDLMKFFNKYNDCTGTSVKTNEAETPASPMYFRLLAGVGFNTLQTSNGSAITDYGSSVALRLGAEMEVVLPFSKGIWAFVVQPIYQKYTGEHPTTKSKLDYSSIDLGGSIRANLYVKEQNSVYASLGAVYALPLKAGGSTPSPSVNMTAGLGARISKFSAELSYGFNRDIHIAYQSTYGGPIVTLGYRLK